jgi:hypothetical protein
LGFVVAIAAAATAIMLLARQNAPISPGESAMRALTQARARQAPEPHADTGGDGGQDIDAPSGRISAEQDATTTNHVGPDDVENLVVQYLTQQTGLELTSLTSIECDATRCEIVFTGTEADPQYVDGYSELWRGMMRHPWKAIRPVQGGIGLRETSPGAKEFVMGFRYLTLELPSDDPDARARQHAVCAGSWARLAARQESAGNAEAATAARDLVERYLDSAAGVLGRERAEQLATQSPDAPVFSQDCSSSYWNR